MDVQAPVFDTLNVPASSIGRDSTAIPVMQGMAGQDVNAFPSPYSAAQAIVGATMHGATVAQSSFGTFVPANQDVYAGPIPSTSYTTLGRSIPPNAPPPRPWNTPPQAPPIPS